MVERWRPENHTFHLPIGECTITLEDVVVLLRLRIDGRVVNGSTNFSRQLIEEYCENLLGVHPKGNEIDRSGIKLGWLNRTFRTLEPNADENAIWCHTHGYILRLLDKQVFHDKTSSTIHVKYLPLLEDLEQIGNYSWGSTCLAYLYRRLCRVTRKTCQEMSSAWSWCILEHGTTCHFWLPFLAYR